MTNNYLLLLFVDVLAFYYNFLVFFVLVSSFLTLFFVLYNLIQAELLLLMTLLTFDSFHHYYAVACFVDPFCCCFLQKGTNKKCVNKETRYDWQLDLALSLPHYRYQYRYVHFIDKRPMALL
jgi:hypothetical protein